jgi:uncharacterized protein YkwD
MVRVTSPPADPSPPLTERTPVTTSQPRLVLARPAARVLAVLGSALVLLLGGAASAQTPQEAREAELVTVVNAERVRHGLAPLAVSPRLTVLARQQSAANAARGRLAHSGDLAQQIRDWRALSENVGYGGSPVSVHQMLMGSRPHRANILSAGSQRVGVGVTTDGAGRIWVTEIFVQPR